MSEDQGMFGYFKKLSLNIIMFKFEDKPIKNNKITANNSQTKMKTSII
jgi:hypothetical protein